MPAEDNISSKQSEEGASEVWKAHFILTTHLRVVFILLWSTCSPKPQVTPTQTMSLSGIVSDVPPSGATEGSLQLFLHNAVVLLNDCKQTDVKCGASR